MPPSLTNLTDVGNVFIGSYSRFLHKTIERFFGTTGLGGGGINIGDGGCDFIFDTDVDVEQFVVIDMAVVVLLIILPPFCCCCCCCNTFNDVVVAVGALVSLLSVTICLIFSQQHFLEYFHQVIIVMVIILMQLPLDLLPLDLFKADTVLRLLVLVTLVVVVVVTIDTFDCGLKL
ncbi:hypothetical protein DERF_009972 [Dermatophagoides farinae]|uniref:Uncharacterized protein n=1 Tax=Dermatophagoides farinae TaxID=6954 RepID=A0A922HXG0_DERFA|nr:hypothetical protein DERF_009972 [Dermatophagoides farinae]